MHALSWSARCRNLLTGHTAILLWLFAHVPFVAIYFPGLWRQQTHYQFFPFAIGAFLWLFPIRKRPGKEHWGAIPWMLIVLDVLCVAVGLLLFQGFRLKAETTGPLTPVSGSLTVLTEGSLPDEIAGFTRGAYVTETRHTTSELGEFSSLWDFSNRGLAARVACDYPFFGWHGLELCYTNQGWLVDDTSSVGDKSGWQAVVVRMTHPTGGRHGIVVYSLFESSGKPLEPKGVGGTPERILERLFRGTQGGLMAPIIYQSQVFTEKAMEFNDDQLQQLLALHFASRDQLRQRIVGANQQPVDDPQAEIP